MPLRPLLPLTAARRIVATLALAFALTGTALAQAQGGADRLRDFFEGLRSLEARFDQVIVQDGRVIQHTTGELHVARPGRFRWSYMKPFEQLIVTDGETLWVYEPDLEQVTRSALDDSVGNTPAALLSTDEPLDNLFTISDAGLEDGTAWAMLEPRAGEETAFERIFLGFDGPALARMEIEDALGQSVLIRFSDLRRNIDLAPELFEFEPPEGVDVIGDGSG